MRKSALFFRPDFHCSFFYRDELRKLGWKADVFVPYAYPEKLLYSEEGIIREFALKGTGRLKGYINTVLLMVWYLTVFWRYKVHIYYGRPPQVSFFEEKLGLTKLFGRSFTLSLFLAKLSGAKLVYLPTGCHDQETKATFSLLDNGNVCGNCGFYEKCDDARNNRNFEVIRRYFDFGVGWDPFNSSQYKTLHFKYKSIDLSIWKPGLRIPAELVEPHTGTIRILHSFFPAGRLNNSKNIKGSPYIYDAVEKLKAEGYPVEYYYIHDKPSKLMRYYQAQADIVVEQLIYGWWGSTGVETMALGKPVVCYLNKGFKEFFHATFPEYGELPIVEADTQSIYQVLKQLVTDEALRTRAGLASRKFAEAHFDPAKNAKAFEEILLKL